MKSQMLMTALAIGILVSQIQAQQITIYCDTNGFDCDFCKSIPSESSWSCNSCAGMGVAVPIGPGKETKQCQKSKAAHCVDAADMETCNRCEPGYSLKVGCWLCYPEEENIPGCSFLKRGLDGELLCGSCGNLMALSADLKRCDVPVTIDNCIEASILTDELICTNCDIGFATVGYGAKKRCDTPVPTEYEGCQSFTDGMESCFRCNSYFGYYMTEPGKCEYKGGSMIQRLFRAYPTLNQFQRLNAKYIQDQFVEIGLELESQIAYGLATAFVESKLIPSPEKRAPEGTERRREQDDYWYTGFYGRGYVQLRWNYNYQKFSTLLKTDFYNNPDKALDPQQAAKIMAYSIRYGALTGYSINTFLNAKTTDFVGARKTVDRNGSDAEFYAKVAEKIMKA